MARLVRDASIAVAAGLIVAVILAVFHVHVLLILIVTLIVAIGIGVTADRYLRSRPGPRESLVESPDPIFDVENSGRLRANVGTFEQRTNPGHEHQPIAHVGKKAEVSLDFGTIRQTHLPDTAEGTDG